MPGFSSTIVNVKRIRFARQRGAVLLTMMLIILIVATTGILATLNSRSSSGASVAENMKAFNSAREALVGYAVSLPELNSDPLQIPGLLPCPDTNGDGFSNPPCGVDQERS